MGVKKKRIIPILLGAAGAVAAFFGVRDLIRWIQQRVHNQQYQEQVRERMQAQAPRYQPVDQPDRAPAFSAIPATGTQAAELASEVTLDMPQGASVETMNTLSGALVDYLLSFNDMIEQLRERRRETGTTNGRSLTPADRTRFEEELERLEDSLAGFSEGDWVDGTLEERIYHLAVKSRDALGNLDYTDDDLFRIYGEIKSESCRLLNEIQSEGTFTGSDLERAFQAYQCD